MKTYMANPDKIERKWYVVDAEGCTLGRLSSEIAKVLRGKNKPEYTPHVDTGDYVIVVNADKVKVTGKKLQQKVYYNHSDYVGGMRETTLAEMLAKKPEKVVELAENSQILTDYLQQNPLMQAAMDQRVNAVQWTAWPGSALEAQQALIDARDQILGRTKDVNTAMDECQAKVQNFIEG